MSSQNQSDLEAIETPSAQRFSSELSARVYNEFKIRCLYT